MRNIGKYADNVMNVMREIAHICILIKYLFNIKNNNREKLYIIFLI
jgi:hypothetical protein